jgi:hypothetical protein
VERDVDDLDAGSRKRKGFCNGGLHEPPGVGESPIAQADNEAGARFARIPLRAVTEPGLTLTDLRVLIVIAWHANKERLAWPSLTTIATLARTTEHKVTVSTKKLETKRLLRKHRRRAKHGWANVYEILLDDPEPPPKSDSAKSDSAKSDSAKSDSASLDGEPPPNSDSRTEDSEQKESPTSRASAREGGSFSNDRGRGLANAYRVIPDAEATQRPPRETVRTTALENSADGGALSDQNSADCGTLSDQNSAVFGTPTEKNIEEITPPSGEHAREEESSSQNGSVDKNQRVRLPSKERGLERRLAALKAYNPSAETIEFAAELAVNALDPHVLGKFIDYYCGIGKPPADCDAAYRYWMSNEWRFAGGHNARRSPKRSSRSRMVDGALNRARAYDG